MRNDEYNIRSFVDTFLGFRTGTTQTSPDELKQQIAALQKQLKELTDRLYIITHASRVHSTDDILKICKRQYPYMYCDEVTLADAQVAREATVGVDSSSLFYTRAGASGPDMYADSPIHSFAIDVSASRILRVHRETSAVLQDGKMEFLDRKVDLCTSFASLNYPEPYGHPHASGSADEGGTSATLCMGNNNANDILASIRRPDDVLLFFRAAYDWLTHVTVGDAYHALVSPISWDSEMRDTIGEAYKTIGTSLRNSVVSPEYTAMVQGIRSGTLTAGTVIRFSDYLRSVVVPALQEMQGDDDELDEMLENWIQFFRCGGSSEEGAGVPHFLAFHQLMSAAALWQPGDEYLGTMLANATLSDMLVGPFAWWHEAELMRRLVPTGKIWLNSSLDEPVQFRSQPGAARYLKSYEYMKRRLGQ